MIWRALANTQRAPRGIRAQGSEVQTVRRSRPPLEPLAKGSPWRRTLLKQTPRDLLILGLRRKSYRLRYSNRAGSNLISARVRSTRASLLDSRSPILDVIRP